VLHADNCARGYYWVRHKNKTLGKKPWIMEKRDGNTWWFMGWDCHCKDMDQYVILGEVEPYKSK
jgi:hypothetical protein